MLAWLSNEIGMSGIADVVNVRWRTVERWKRQLTVLESVSAKAIWRLYMDLRHPERRLTLFDLATWGRYAGWPPEDWSDLDKPKPKRKPGRQPVPAIDYQI